MHQEYPEALSRPSHTLHSRRAHACLHARSRLHRIEVMERTSSSSMRLPTAVRAAALAAVGGTRLQKEFAWMSWAGPVWPLQGHHTALHPQRPPAFKLD